MQLARGSVFCSFCGRTTSETAAIVTAPGTGAFICVNCLHNALGEIEAENMKAVAGTDELVEIGARDERR